MPPRFRFRFVSLVVAANVVPLACQAASSTWAEKVDPWVLDQLVLSAAGESEFLIVLAEQADLSRAVELSTKRAKGRYVVERLRETAARTQAPLLDELARAGVVHRPFWIANMIWAKGGEAAVASLAARHDVARITANPKVGLDSPSVDEASAPLAPEAVGWNISMVNADDLWSLGFTGQGAVIGGHDTGCDWDHPALQGKYRGWNGATADHNYNWHDAVHSGGGSCGPNSPAPCDDTNHGTHTMGTMVGADGANQVGMAPGAKWIGCRNMDQGIGTPATYSECYQWFIAPTALDGLNPDPAMAPDVINNSWSCPSTEGCTDPNVMQLVVKNLRAAGIFTAHSAGNSGPNCSSVNAPSAIYGASFTVGNTTSTDSIAGSSSRGPVTVDGSNRRKPDISAPGTSVRSSVPGTGYATFSGTSMAGPHVAGSVALLISARPALAGNVDGLEEILRESAVHPATSAQVCGGLSATVFPNNTFGFGRIDALAAWQLMQSGFLFRDGFGSGSTDDWSQSLP